MAKRRQVGIAGPPRWSEEIPVLGIRVRFEYGTGDVRRAVQAAFGPWRDLPAQLVSDRAVTVRIEVHSGHESRAQHAPVRYWMPDRERLVATAPNSFACADRNRGEAVADVSRGLAADSDHFRYTIVEAMTLFLLSGLDRQPFHCAAVVRDGAGVLLTGPAGIGKSTLAYAAMRGGFQVFAEDLVWVQQRPSVRLWGLVSVIRLSPGAARFFPALARQRKTLLANGQLKVAVPIRGPARPRLPVLDRAVVCLVERSGSVPRLKLESSRAVERVLRERLESGFDLFPDTIDAVVGSFARNGGWTLGTGDDPFATVPLLAEMLDAPVSP